ncbi:uncharacterized protein [Littorina saxatilis]|uniref:Uncharacterized protein n=1 Tax=Littorina saxatilis TaxID=31220 RepID=A0AAN9GGE8_9CAEN
MKSTTVAIVAVLLLFVFRLDTQVFISAGVVMARDVKRAVCPSVVADITSTCDEKTSHLEEGGCPWLMAQEDCLLEMFLECNEVNKPMAVYVKKLLQDAAKQRDAECQTPDEVAATI